MKLGATDIREWWELIFGNAYKVEFQVNDNLIKGIWLKATRNVRQNGILYLHGGQFDIETQNISRFTDCISYRTMGYQTLMLKFPEEDEGGICDPNRDIPEIKDSRVLFRSLCPIDKINIVTVSRGGYPGLFAFQLYPDIFNKIVCMCPPIHTENNVWLDPQHQWAKDYLRRKVPSPMVLAEQGAYAGLQDRMLMIGGATDTTCPPAVNSDKFAKLVGCKSVIVPGYGHNVSMSTMAREQCLQFMRLGTSG